MITEDVNDIYLRRKKDLFFIHAGVTFLFFLAMAFSFSHPLNEMVRKLTGSSIIVITLYFFFFYILYFFSTFFLKYYDAFILERLISKEKKNFKEWLNRVLQVEMAVFGVMLVGVQVVYFFLEIDASWWWIAVGLATAAICVLSGDVFPRFIAPFFVKYSVLENEILRRKLTLLAGSGGVSAEKIFVSNGFLAGGGVILAGMGQRLKIVVSEDILDYSPDEVAVMLAREIAYNLSGYIWKVIAFQAAGIMTAFFLTGIFFAPVSRCFGFDLVFDIETLPVLLGLLFVFSVGLLVAQNFYKRRVESRMDWYSLQLTEAPDAFISLLIRSLQKKNRESLPHYFMEQMMGDQAMVIKRITMAQDYAQSLKYQKVNRKF